MSRDWSALFLPAPSPGSLVRFLERRTRAGETYPVLLLSEPTAPHGYRALSAAVAPGHTLPDALAPLGGPLSLAFSCRVTWLWQTETSAPQWGYVVFEEGVAKERREEELPAPRGGLVRLAARLPGARPALSPPEAYAVAEGLPLNRVPAAVRARPPVPIVDYVTVAQLDQRGLLVENGPRLYRFDPARPDEPAE